MVETAKIIWADGPTGTPNEPDKAQIRAWGSWLENLTAALNLSVTATYIRGTKAQLDAVTGATAGQVGIVVADDDVSLRGVYDRQGSSWVRKLDLPADAAQAAADVAEGARDVAIDARDIALAAQEAAEDARDIAAGYASDAVSQGNVPVYATKAGMSALTVPVGMNAIRVNGQAAAGDGLGGLYIDTNNGSADTFTSNGGARQWYRSAERGRDFSISLTVGPLGDYATISAAIAAASVMGGPRYKSGGMDVDIVLKAGFVMQEQVVADRIDLSWLRIRSEDAIVPMRRSALILPIYGIYYPAFTASRGGGLPSIHALFEMDDSGSGVNREAFFIVDGSFGYLAPGSGARNVGGRALHVANSSYAVARATDLRNAGHATPDDGTDIPGAAVRNGQSIVEIRGANLSNSTIGLKTAGGAVTDAEFLAGTTPTRTNVSGCRIGIENYNSVVRFGGGLANGCNIALKQFHGSFTAVAATFDDAVAGAIELRENASADLRSCSMKRSGGGQAVYVSGSHLFMGNANVDDAQGHAISAEGGWVEGVAASIKNAGRSGTGYAVNSVNGSHVTVQGADGSGAAGVGANGVAFMTNFGSIINANNATGLAGRTVNTLSRHGVIYQ